MRKVFKEAVEPYSCHNTWRRRTHKQLFKLYRKCKHPLLLFVAMEHCSSEDWKWRNTYCNQLLELIRKLKSPILPDLFLARTYGHLVYNWCTSQTRDPLKVRDVATLVATHLKQAWESGDFSAHPELFAESVVNLQSFHLVLLEDYSAVIESIPLTGEHLWIKEVHLAVKHRNIAWLHRGGGWASTVEKSAWQEFRDNLSKAEAHAREAIRLQPDSILAHKVLLNVVGPRADAETLRSCFENTIALCFDSPQPYRTYLNFSGPRWGGSQETQLAFAAECVDTERWDTGVPDHFITACNGFMSDMRDLGTGESTKKLMRSSAARKLAKRYLAGRREHPTGSESYRTGIEIAINWHFLDRNEAVALAADHPDVITKEFCQRWNLDQAALRKPESAEKDKNKAEQEAEAANVF